MNLPADVLPGDVLAVDTGTSWGNVAIRAGEWLKRWRARKSTDPPPAWPWMNHVIMVTDLLPKPLGIEGRPGGVGYVDLSTRTWRHLSSDARLPKTEAQRAVSVEWARGVAFGKEYDWDAIGAIGLDAAGVHEVLELLGIPDLWRADWDGKGIPGHVICSTAWVWIRDQQGLARPLPDQGGRYITPDDWDHFNRQLP